MNNTAPEDIYLDYAAATPVDARVLDAMLPFFSDVFYNPSAPYALARRARAAFEDARAELAHCIGARPTSITLTAGATEANNLAFASVDGTVLTDAIEHESTLACAKAREHVLVGVTGEGFVTPPAIANALTPDVELVSVALANGEIGTVQNLREIAAVVKAERQRRLDAGETHPLWLHTDASQAAGALSLNVSTLEADLVTISAAKIYGPKQVGLLWASDDVKLRPLVLGGGQEGGLRSGTENVPGVVGFAEALKIATAERAQESLRLAQLRDRLQGTLLREFPWAVVSGPKKGRWRLPGLLHISFPGLEARRLVILLDQRGVSVGTGSACAASKMRISHVLTAIGADATIAAGSLRITLGRPTTSEQVEAAARIIIDVVNAERQRLGIQ